MMTPRQVDINLKEQPISCVQQREHKMKVKDAKSGEARTPAARQRLLN